MTVSSTTTPIKQYTGNGVTTAFSTVFTFNLSTDLVVILTDTSGVDTVQTITTHYTVSGGSGSNGTVTFVTAPASGYIVTLQRVTPKTQNTDYIENDSFPASAHEAALDKLTYISQEFEDTLNRILRVPVTSGLTSIEVPVAADEYIKWNAAGTNIETAALASLGALSFSANGILVYTGSTALTSRTITGTTNEITVTNGDGVSANPIISLPSTLILTGKTVEVTDSTFSVKDNADATKILKFELGSITTGTTRTLTVPDASGTIALTSDITGFAPTSASYVTLGADATLDHERVLTAGTGISITDAGAGSTVTIANTGLTGQILQVQSAVYTAATSTTSSTFAGINSVAITPSSTSNKILVIVQSNLAIASTSTYALGRIVRGSTPILVGDAAGSRVVTQIANTGLTGGGDIQAVFLACVDSPATTSATTYTFQIASSDNATAVLVNRTNTDTNSSVFPRGATTIIAMEIKG